MLYIYMCVCVCFISPITTSQAFDCWCECFAIGVTPALRISLPYTRDNNLAGIQTSETGAVCAIYFRVQKCCI